MIGVDVVIVFLMIPTALVAVIQIIDFFNGR